MAFQVLDVEKDKPLFTQRVTLDERDYVLSFAWNMRHGWYMGVSAGDEVLFHPRKVVLDTDLLLSVRWHALCPPGLLIAMDTTGRGQPPGFEDLRGGPSRLGRVILAYGDAT